MALTADDKTWFTATIKAQVLAVIKAETYGQVWEQDRMAPPVGQGTPTNATWQPQSLLRYSGERADTVLAQARVNGSTGSAANAKLDTVLEVLGSLDLGQIPAAVAAKLEALKFTITEG